MRFVAFDNFRMQPYSRCYLRRAWLCKDWMSSGKYRVSELMKAGILVKWDYLTHWGSGNIVGSIPENCFSKKTSFIWEIPNKDY